MRLLPKLTDKKPNVYLSMGSMYVCVFYKLLWPTCSNANFGNQWKGCQPLSYPINN